MNNKTRKIVELANEKAEIKRISVLSAIDIMKKEQREINFTSVSKEAAVSRNYLYKNDELRYLIESLRTDKIKKVQSKDAKDIIIDAQKKKITELEKKLKLLDGYDKLFDKYTNLLNENEELKKQLKNAYKY